LLEKPVHVNTGLYFHFFTDVEIVQPVDKLFLFDEVKMTFNEQIEDFSFPETSMLWILISVPEGQLPPD
jgi:hypothetical protein